MQSTDPKPAPKSPEQVEQELRARFGQLNKMKMRMLKRVGPTPKVLKRAPKKLGPKKLGTFMESLRALLPDLRTRREVAVAKPKEGKPRSLKAYRKKRRRLVAAAPLGSPADFKERRRSVQRKDQREKRRRKMRRRHANATMRAVVAESIAEAAT